MYSNFFKRFFDCFASLIGLIVLSPIFIIVTISLFFANQSKPFFFQKRPGKNNRIFSIVKFKTMNDKTDASGALLPDAERLTSISSFVGKTSLDEIPQLINVLKGDMSLIGPRPLLEQYIPLYSPEQARRNAISVTRKFELDVYYVDHISFTLDFRKFLSTIKKVFILEGISQEGEATMEIFNGNN